MTNGLSYAAISLFETTLLIMHAMSLTASSIAQSIHPRSRFIFDTQDNPLTGGQCSIFVFQSQLGDRFAIRIEHGTGEHRVDLVEVQVDCLQCLADAHIAHVPKLLAYGLSPEPHLVLQWMDGSTLQWNDETPPSPQRDTILGAMARFAVDLCRVSRKGRFLS